MRMRKFHLSIGLVFVLSTLCEATASASDIEVAVYGEHSDGKVKYHYSITNRTAKPLYRFTIGVGKDPEKGYFYPQLDSKPIGSHEGQCGENGCSTVLSLDGVSQPVGWSAWFYGQEEISWYYLEWHVADDALNPEIAAVLPGETKEGFTVVLPKRDGSYVRKDGSDVPVGFRVNILGADKNYYPFVSSITLLDATPPHLSVSVNPVTLWPPNGKLTDVSVVVQASDDYDGQPEIALESITANEPLTEGDIDGADFGKDDRDFRLAAKRDGAGTEGRIYTITYSATDAVGNRSTRSVIVTVPHDQGN